MFIPNVPQCRSYNSMKGYKLRGQFIVDHHMATQMRGFIIVGIRPSGIDLCFIDANLSFDDHRGMPVGAANHTN